MGPRVLSRTHYQIDEPAYLRILVLECASPTRSDYPEAIAKRLHDRLEISGIHVNLPAARYAVDLARALGLLTENNFWSELGHVLKICEKQSNAIDARSQVSLGLSDEERIFFFRLFLEFDGAALIFFARILAGQKVLPPEGKDWNYVADEMMKYAYESYLKISTDIQERIRLRHGLERRLRTPYAGKSGAHQIFVHLQSLVRMGFLASDVSTGGRRYLAPAAFDTAPLRKFLTLVPDVVALERVIANRKWAEVSAQVLVGLTRDAPNLRGRIAADAVAKQFESVYRRVMATSVPLCSIRTLIEASQVCQLAQGTEPWDYDDAFELLKRMQAGSSRSVRFHVDRIGRPAFVTFPRDDRGMPEALS